MRVEHPSSIVVELKTFRIYRRNLFLIPPYFSIAWSMTDWTEIEISSNRNLNKIDLFIKKKEKLWPIELNLNFWIFRTRNTLPTRNLFVRLRCERLRSRVFLVLLLKGQRLVTRIVYLEL